MRSLRSSHLIARAAARRPSMSSARLAMYGALNVALLSVPVHLVAAQSNAPRQAIAIVVNPKTAVTNHSCRC